MSDFIWNVDLLWGIVTASDNDMFVFQAPKKTSPLMQPEAQCARHL